MSNHNNAEICRRANQHNDVLFSLMSLKQKLLVKAQECDNCHIESKDWVIISNCHHKICQNCINGSTHSKDTCPKCKLKFNPEVHVTTSCQMRAQYSEMEQVIWNIMALENGTLPEVLLKEGPSSNNSENGTLPEVLLKEGSSSNNSENGTLPEVLLKEGSSSKNSENGTLPKVLLEKGSSSNNSENGTLSEVLFEEGSSSNNSELVNFNLSAEKSLNEQNSELLSSNHCVPQSSTEFVVGNIEEIQLSDKASSEELSRDISLVELNSAEIEELGSDVDNFINETKANSSSSKSEDDIIEGTPEKCHASKKIVVSHSSLNDEDFDMLEKFVNFFNVEANSSWNDSVTHLVVKTVNGNLCFRTKKYFNALLSHCRIVSFDWIIDCLLMKSLLPEVNYMPFDTSKQPAALMSWEVGQGLIKSSMEWTKDCILFFHPSIEQSNNSYSDIIAFAKKAGFVLADDLTQFNEKFKIRVILFDSPLNDLMEDVKGWKFEHDAWILSLDWLLECLGQYRFVPISSEYQIM